MYKSFKWRRPAIEDDLKILKKEYLSKRILDHAQILKLSLDDQAILFNPQNEDYLQWKPTSKY
jgi:hypothetical protein